MNPLYEALEQCLNEIERGADVDTVLFRHPALADELRPILEAALKAKSMAVTDPSPDIVRRNRAKVLQHAAQMREAKIGTRPSRFWFASLRRLAVTLMVIALILVSGTGLVRAATNTLPGDNLYPVKRTWEDVRVFFTFDAQKRETLEFERENKRLEELRELFVKGRSARVDFAGYVTRQEGSQWRVAGVPILITAQTRLPDEPVVAGAAVRVRGVTQADGSVLAERIQLLSPGTTVPVVDDDAIEEKEHENQEEEESKDNSGKGSSVEPTKTPQPKKTSFEGAVSAMEGRLWVVSGVVVNVGNAEIRGTPRIGAIAKVEGYFNSSGVFIAERIEFKDDGSNSGSSSGPGNSNTNNANTNSNGDDPDDNNNNNNNDDNDNGNENNSNDD